MTATGQSGDKHFVPHPDYDSLQSILGSMAELVRTYARRRKYRNELMNCSADDVARIAADLNINQSELAAVAERGPGAADLLQKLLVALGIDPKDIDHRDPAVMRDLQRSCVMCDEKRRCKFDLANGVAADNFRDYCPNAHTLDALLQAKQERRRERRRKRSGAS